MRELAAIQMTAFKSKFQKRTVIFGLLFLLTYLFQDFLWEQMWIWSFLLMVLPGLVLIIIFVAGLIKKDKKVIPVFIGVVVVITSAEVLKSETFKSEKILEASLYDDLSVINLTLRKNNTFEINSATMFGNQNFNGKYKLANDKIIFPDKHYNNNFIPDTLTIIKDKIFFKFDKDNKSITEFATCFKVTKNKLQNSR